MRKWQPPVDLRRLLDALGEEILAASEAEVHQAYGETGRSLAVAVRDVRTLIAAVNEGQDDPDPTIPLADAMRRRESCFRQH